MSTLIIVSLILCSARCEKLVDHEYGIKNQNNSKETSQFYESYNSPDTSIDVVKPRLKTAYPSKFSFLDSTKDLRCLKHTPIISSMITC
jgi:hypothetical protein